MKSIVKIAFLSLLSCSVYAQSLLQGQYQFNYLSMNPAFAGSKGVFGMTAMLGNQFNGTPRPLQVSQIFSTDGVVGEKSGLGLQAFNGTAGNIRNLGLDVSYAYRMEITEQTKFSVGFDGGFVVQPNVLTTATSRYKPYFGTGILLQNEGYFLSISKPYLLANAETAAYIGKPFISMLGISFGDMERTALNTSAALGINKYGGNYWHLNGKAWFSKRFGLGISLRHIGTDGFKDANTKMIYQLEYQPSTTLRIGLSYDPKPMIGSYVPASQQINNGILQLMFRFEPDKEADKGSIGYY